MGCPSRESTMDCRAVRVPYGVALLGEARSTPTPLPPARARSLEASAGSAAVPKPAFLPAWLLWLQHERRNVIGPLIYTVSWPFRYPLSLQK